MQDLNVGEEKGAWKKNTRIIMVTHKEIWTRAFCWCIKRSSCTNLPTIFFTPTSIFLFSFPPFFPPPETWLVFLRVDNDYPFSSCSDIREARRPIGLLLSSDPYNYPQQTKCCQRPYSRFSGYHGMKICFLFLTY